jgi:ammonia channel protein AmtB
MAKGDDVAHTINNLWVLIAALLVFTMTISVGFLEVGELGEELHFSLLKTILMTGSALVVMAFVGFNTAFAPTGKRGHRTPLLFSRLLLGRLLGQGAVGEERCLVVDTARLPQHRVDARYLLPV